LGRLLCSLRSLCLRVCLLEAYIRQRYARSSASNMFLLLGPSRNWELFVGYVSLPKTSVPHRSLSAVHRWVWAGVGVQIGKNRIFAPRSVGSTAAKVTVCHVVPAIVWFASCLCVAMEVLHLLGVPVNDLHCQKWMHLPVRAVAQYRAPENSCGGCRTTTAVAQQSSICLTIEIYFRAGA